MSPEPLGGLVALQVNEVQPSPNNPRENLTGIDELAVSIRENGLIQPIVVQRIPGQKKLQILAGHRRYAAVCKLGWTKIPAIIRRDMLPDEELLLMLVENGQRAGLDPIEEARAISRLKTQGLTDTEIGRRIGRSQNHVSGRLALLALPVEEQEALRAGFGTITNAVSKARTEAGITRPGAKGKRGPAHLSSTHPLATKVANRCRTKGHKRGKGAGVGGIGCGQCWEAVIRADEDAGISYRQADHWRSQGYITVSYRTRHTGDLVTTVRSGRATGYVAYLDTRQARTLSVLAALVKAGMRPGPASALAAQIVETGHATVGPLTITTQKEHAS